MKNILLAQSSEARGDSRLPKSVRPKGVLSRFVEKFPVKASLVAASLMLGLSTAGAQVSVFSQGFEDDTAGWSALSGTIGAFTSGTDGIPSASGANHAVSTGNAFTRFGEYRSAYPNGGYSTSVKIYLDVDAGWANDRRFDWIVASSKQDGGHLRDYTFNVGFYDSADATGPGASTNRFIISASNNAGPGNSYPKNPGRNPVAVGVTGWYVFEHHFQNVGGALSVELVLKDPSNNVVTTWTLSDPGDLIASVVGGNRYGWLAFNTFSSLALDDSELIFNNPASSLPVLNVTRNWQHATIQGAVNGASAGEVIQVSEGVFQESSGGGDALLINKSVTITGAGPATYDGSGQWTGGTLITRGPGAGGQALNQVVNVTANDATLNALTVDGRYGFDTNTQASTNYGVFVSGQGFSISNAHIIDFTNSGLEFNNANDGQVTNVSIKRTAFAPAYYAEANSGLRCVDSENLDVNGLTVENARRGIVVFQGDNSGTLHNVNITGTGTATSAGILFSTSTAPGWWQPAFGTYEGSVTFTLGGNHVISNCANGIFISDYLLTEDIALTVAPGAAFNFYNNVTNGGQRANQGTATNIDAVMAAMGLTDKTAGPPDFYNYPVPTVLYVDDDWTGSSLYSEVEGHVFGYDAFATIQEAIDAAAVNATINVLDGTYEEHQIFISKPLNLIGPNADKAGNAGDRVAEAIIQFPASAAANPFNYLIYANQDNTTLAGFDLRYQDSLVNSNSADFAVLVYAVPVNNLTIRNNRMYSSEIPIYVAPGPAPKNGLLIEGNYIDCGPFVNNQFNRGMYITYTAGSIQDNTLVNTSIGIQYMPYDNPTPGLIQRNTVSSGLAGLYHNFQWVGAAPVTWTQNVVTIAPNDQSGLKANIRESWTTPVIFRGIQVLTFGSQGSGNAPEVTFTNNSVDSTLNPLEAYNSTVLQAVRFTDPYGTGTATFTDNSFTGWTTAVSNQFPATFDMSGNWWGTTSDTAINDAIVNTGGGGIDFSPFLASSTDADAGAAGFQGDFSQVFVTALGAQTISDSRIQEGLDSLVDGGDLTVLGGTYPGDVDSGSLNADLHTGAGTDTAVVSVGGNLALGSGINLHVQINGTTPGTAHDQWSVSGSVTLGSASLILSGSFNSPLATDSIILLDKTSPGAISGTFSGIPEGFEVAPFIGTSFATATYLGGTGNDFAFVEISSEPIILTGPVNTTVEAYEPFSLSAIAVGYPAPSFAWYFNDVLIDGETSSTLSVPLASMLNAGTYKVVATNTFGSDEASAVVTVIAKDVLVTDADLPLLDGNGDPVPGVKLYRPLFGVLNNDGRFVVKAQAENGSGGILGSNNEMVLTDASGALAVVGQESMVAGGGTFAPQFRNLNIHDTNFLTYENKINGVGAALDQAYLVSEDGQSLDIYSQEGDIAAGADGGTFKIHNARPAIAKSGIIYLGSQVAGGTTATTKTDSGIWYDDGTSLELLVREGDAAPTVDPAWVGQIRKETVVAGAANVAFVAALQNDPLDPIGGRTNTKLNQAILAGEPGQPMEVIARKGDEISPGLVLLTLTSVAANQGENALEGHVYIAKLSRTGGVTNADDDVMVVKMSGGAPEVVVREGDDIDGRGTLKKIEDYYLTNDGKVVFKAQLNVPPTSNQVICRWDSGVIEVLAQKGTPSPDGPNFGTIATLSVSPNGMIAFRDNRAVWKDVGSGVQRALKVGDLVIHNGSPRSVFAYSFGLAKSVNARFAGGGFAADINDAGAILPVLSIGSGEYIVKVIP